MSIRWHGGIYQWHTESESLSHLLSAKVLRCVKHFCVSCFSSRLSQWRITPRIQQWLFETGSPPVTLPPPFLSSWSTPLFSFLPVLFSSFTLPQFLVLPGICLSPLSRYHSPVTLSELRLSIPQNGCWGRLGVAGQRCAAEAGDFPPPWGLSHRGKYDRLWHLRLT